MKRRRLDEVLIEKVMAKDRREAFVLITEGRVMVRDQKAVSPAQLVDPDDEIEVRPPREFVGRGAVKLASALEHFGMDVQGKVCADIGAATGGFTEVLLKHGAKKVYAIDVGRGKLNVKLREDPRVVAMEGMNVLALGDAVGERLPAPARSAALAEAPRSRPSTSSGRTMPARRFERPQRHPLRVTSKSPAFIEQIDIVTIDVSFTSLRKVLPVVRSWLPKRGRVIALFKPQYEIEDKSLLKHGIVRDEAARQEAVKGFRTWLEERGWEELGFMESPIRGREGNVEYLFHLAPQR